MSLSFAPSSTSCSAAPAMKSATTASTAVPHPSMKMPVCPVATKLVLWPRFTSASRSWSCAVILPTLQSLPTASTTSASTSAARPSAMGRFGGGLRASRIRTPRAARLAIDLTVQDMANQHHRDAQHRNSDDQSDGAQQGAHDQHTGDREHGREIDAVLHDPRHHEIRLEYVHDHAQENHEQHLHPVARGDHKERRQQRRDEC